MARKQLWGSALAIGLLASAEAWAQSTPTLSTIYSFPDSLSAGLVTPLIFDGSGALYSATGPSAPGVFKLTPPATTGAQWTETPLYQTRGLLNGGILAASGLIFDASGALYGTFRNHPPGVSGNGTVYKLTPQPDGTWTETNLYTFNEPADGQVPSGALVMDSSGALYGTTQLGGASGGGNFDAGCGRIFKLSLVAGVWAETVLHDFSVGLTEETRPLDWHGHLWCTLWNDDTRICF
jgi:hypothetical protein